VPRQRLAARPVLEFQHRSLHKSQRTFDSTTAKPAIGKPTAEAITTAVSKTHAPKKINKDTPRSLEDGAENLVSAEKEKLRMERAARQELKYLGDDPWKFSEFVKKALGKGRFEEAYFVVQMGSRHLQLVVPWTLLMDHLLQQQQLTKAIKLFNEVSMQLER
jgi:hypothetical protein